LRRDRKRSPIRDKKKLPPKPYEKNRSIRTNIKNDTKSDNNKTDQKPDSKTDQDNNNKSEAKPNEKIQTKNRILNHILEPNLLATEHAKDQIQEKKENLDLDRQKPIRFMLII